VAHGVLQASIMERKEWQRGIIGAKAEDARLFDRCQLAHGINRVIYVGYPTSPLKKPYKIPKRGTLSLWDSVA